MSLYSNLPPLTRTIGGSVTGLDLASSGVVLQNNLGDDLTITANGPYTFATPIDEGLNYSVTVLTDPTAPTQVCTVAGATGTVINTNITTANVTCTTTTFTIGGTITGLAGNGLILQNNGGDDYLPASGDTAFTFATPVNDGAAYAVSVATDPTGLSQTCTATTNSGTAIADVIDVSINCITNTFTIGGTISFVTATQTLVIQNNLGNDITLTNADANFTFTIPITDGLTYDVTEFTTPAAGTCVYTNSSGTVAGTNVINVDIACP